MERMGKNERMNECCGAVVCKHSEMENRKGNGGGKV